MTARAERKLLRRLAKSIELQRNAKLERIIAGYPNLAALCEVKVAQLEEERASCLKRLGTLTRPHAGVV